MLQHLLVSLEATDVVAASNANSQHIPRPEKYKVCALNCEQTRSCDCTAQHDHEVTLPANAMRPSCSEVMDASMRDRLWMDTYQSTMLTVALSQGRSLIDESRSRPHFGITPRCLLHETNKSSRFESAGTYARKRHKDTDNFLSR
jgi:hypothetical protein